MSPSEQEVQDRAERDLARRLSAEMAAIEEALADFEETMAGMQVHELYRPRRMAVEDALRSLGRDALVTFGDVHGGAGGSWVKILGRRSSSTAGLSDAVRNWIAGVVKRTGPLDLEERG